MTRGAIAMVTMMAAGLAGGGAAGAAETVLDAAQLDGLLTGNTVYLALPPGGPGGPDGGMAAFHYGGDGSAKASLPVGTVLVGTWSIDGAQYCVDWDNGPKGSCTRLVKDGEAIRLVNVADDAPRGAIDHIRPGNPEGL